MLDSPNSDPNRRPLKSRSKQIFIALANKLASLGITPNAISVLSAIFGLIAGAALALTSHIDSQTTIRLLFFLAALTIQLRLLCNMLDGMVAINTNTCSPTGELYNEIPDRISDAAALIGAGYALNASPTLGFTAAVLAITTAYIRALGASLNLGQTFHGPLAKPQRMFFLTLACLLHASLPSAWQSINLNHAWSILDLTLLIIIVGTALTILRRTLIINQKLKQQNTPHSDLN